MASVVHRLDAEDHAHDAAHLDTGRIHVREFRGEAPAALEVEHAVIGRWIGRIGQTVGGVGRDASMLLGQRLIFLCADTGISLIDANIALRELHRASLGGAPSDEGQHGFAVAV